MNRCLVHSAIGVLLVTILCCQTAPVEDVTEGPDNAICGTVTNEKGEPLPGVTIQVCGLQSCRHGEWRRVCATGAMPRYFTDKHGRFSVPASATSRLDLWFCGPGYAPTFLYDTHPSSERRVVVLGRGLAVDRDTSLLGGIAHEGVTLAVSLPAGGLGLGDAFEAGVAH